MILTTAFLPVLFRSIPPPVTKARSPSTTRSRRATSSTVLGPGTVAPAAPGSWPLSFNKDGSPRNNRDGTQRRDRFKPDHDDATAFVVRLGPDFKKIVSISRLPSRERWSISKARA